VQGRVAGRGQLINTFEFAKDLMEGGGGRWDSKENFWKGNLNDVLSATQGSRVSRGAGEPPRPTVFPSGSGVICDRVSFHLIGSTQGP
jgi:hypothetical protein